MKIPSKINQDPTQVGRTGSQEKAGTSRELEQFANASTPQILGQPAKQGVDLTTDSFVVAESRCPPTAASRCPPTTMTDPIALSRCPPKTTQDPASSTDPIALARCPPKTTTDPIALSRCPPSTMTDPIALSRCPPKLE